MVGASGSGKSTLLNILGGLDVPSAGRATVAGHHLGEMDAKERTAYRRRVIGFVWQQSARNLLPYPTAAENVELPMLLEGVAPGERQSRATQLLELVGLGGRATHRPNELSGGEQQRVAIARALVNEPALILADEPTGELDSTTSTQLMATLRDLNRDRGVTIVIVTHDAGVAGDTDRVVRLSDGRVIADERRDTRAFTRALAGEPSIDGGTRVWARLGDLLERARGQRVG